MSDNDANDDEPGDGTDSATDAGTTAAGGQSGTGGQGGAGGQGGTAGQGAAGGQATGGRATGATAGRQSSPGSDLEPNVAGALCYALAWLSGLFFFFTEEDDDFVRFHAAQSIVAFGALTAIYVVLNQFLAAMLWSPGGIGFLRLIGFVNTLVGLVGFALWLGMMYLAYEGRRFELPIAGDVANNLISEKDVTVERRSAGD